MIKSIKLLLAFWFAFATSFANAQLLPATVKPLPTFNAIVNGGFENGKTGWVTYKDATQALPVDGVSGTATTISFTAPTTSPLFEKASGLITHAATNGQGEGVAYDFTLQGGDKGKVQAITGTYQIASGTYSGGTSTTDSDIEVYVYDKDTSTLIQPAGYKLDGGVSGINYNINATFQPVNINSSNYRLIFHNATSTASAFTLKIDSLYVGTQIKNQGSPTTDWIPYTTTLSNSTNATVNSSLFRRVGDSIEIRGFITWSGAGAGAGFTVSLPSGYSIDTTKFNGSIQNAIEGYGMWLDNGVARKAVQMTYNTTTTFTFEELTSSAGALVGTGFGTGDTLSYFVHVPVTGWSSTTTMSDTSDTRVVSFIGSGTGSTQSLTASVTNVSATTVKDSHGAWTGSTYVVPVPGDYNIAGFLYSSATTATFSVYVNGSFVKYLFYSVAASGGSGSQIVPGLKAGDVLSIRSNATLTLAGDGGQTISISRISGPTQIAASESVTARYRINANKTTSTQIDYDTKIYDSHNAVVTGAGWTFTAPISGKYRVTVTALTTAAVADNLAIWKNSSTDLVICTVNTATVNNGSGTVQLNAGDFIYVRTVNSTSGTYTSTDSGLFNQIEIERVGN